MVLTELQKTKINESVKSLPKRKTPHNLGGEIIVSDPNGNIEQIYPMKSFLVAFLATLCTQFKVSPSNATQIKDVAGTLRTIPADADNYQMGTASADVNYNILVGTGTSSVAIDNYVMDTLIGHGVGAGQLEHGATTYDEQVTVSGSDIYFDIYRSFTNNSGAGITINEIGLYMLTDIYRCMHERSLVTIAISNGQTKIITYRLKLSTA